MFNTILDDMIGSAQSAYHGADPVTLGIYAVVALLIGLRCNSLPHVFSHALEGMILAGLALAAYQIAWPFDALPSSAAAWSDGFGVQWERVMSFTVLKLLGYYMMMLAGLLIVFLLKRLITRR